MVDLKAKPFYLDDDAIAWVNGTIEAMTIEEKIGQLFVIFSGGGTNEEELKAEAATARMGGVRYSNRTAAEVWEQNRLLQKHSKLPLLIAANVEQGGSGACTDGTQVGYEVKVAATNDVRYGYQLGRVGGLEAKATGCNWAFSPIMDLQLNWRNPIISTRTFSSEADKTLAFGLEFMRGLHDAGMAATVKHFPGDGVDERDHHFSNSVNTMTAEEWDNSFGKIYAGMIENGVEAVMAGHIMLPAYQRVFSPGAHGEELLPATLCKELLCGLLRQKLGFNGVIVTDASHMVGLTGRMARKDLVPAAIAAGCDMFLFFNDVVEDSAYMRAGIESGVVTQERLNDALSRILGLKAKLGLHRAGGNEPPEKSGLRIVGCEEHQKIAREVSERAITLAKQVGECPLPLNTKAHKRVMLMPVQTPSSVFSQFVGAKNGGGPVAEMLRNKLAARGFDVTVYEFPAANSQGKGKGAYGHKSKVGEFAAKYDLVITVANVASFQVTQRLSWQMPKGGFELPWYVHDVPTVFVSFCCPFHLADVPQVKTYINCYDTQEHTVDALVEKLTGKSAFTGVSPVDVFCGLPDTQF